jgi:hypothetical protein
MKKWKMLRERVSRRRHKGKEEYKANRMQD